MRKRYLLACAAIFAACAHSVPTMAQGNPFVPNEEGPSAFELEGRIRNLESQSMQVDTRVEQYIATQLPLIKASLLESGAGQAEGDAEGDAEVEIIGRVNENCIGRKTLKGRVTLVKLDPDMSCPGF